MRLAPLLLLAGAAYAGDAPHPARGMPPAGRVSVEEAIEKGVGFLVENQNGDGSFGRAASPIRYQLWCHVPGGHQAFQGASTALAWMGLRMAPHQPDASKQAQEKCLSWMVDHVHVKRAFPEQFYNTWSLAYGLRALAMALETKAEGAPPEKIRATMVRIVETLEVMQTPDGGWGYLDFNVPARKKFLRSTNTDGEGFLWDIQHQGRIGQGTNDTLWCAWLLDSGDHRWFFAGDTGF